MWSKDFQHCRKCGTDEVPHMAKGLCRKCYLLGYVKQNAKRIKEKKHDWYVLNVTKEDQRITREQNNFDGKREKILKRDGYKCTECSEDRISKLTVHHKDGNGRGNENPNNDDENLQTLCRACHARKHSTNTQWARNYPCCRRCGTTERKHNAKGLCWKCYLENR